MRPRRDESSAKAAPVPSIASRLMAPIDVRGERQPQRVVVRQGADAGHQLRPVQQGQALLGAELERRQAGTLERIGARARAGAVDRSPLPRR